MDYLYVYTSSPKKVNLAGGGVLTGGSGVADGVSWYAGGFAFSSGVDAPVAKVRGSGGRGGVGGIGVPGYGVAKPAIGPGKHPGWRAFTT